MFWNLIFGLLIGYAYVIIHELGGRFLKWELHKKHSVTVKIKGYHIHHSVIGVIFLALFIFFPNLIYLGIAIGIIIRHTQAEKRFVFIEKD